MATDWARLIEELSEPTSDSGDGDKRSSIAIWWRAVRSFSFPASVMPALLGIALAWMEGRVIRIDIAILAIIGAVAAHSGANLINDYIDFKRGVDRVGTNGGSGIIVDGSLSPRAVLIGSIVAFAIALASAVPLCLRAGAPLAWLVLAGFIVAAGYVLPPLRLKYRALGDFAVFTAFGLGVTLGSYMAQSSTFLWAPLFYAAPVGLLVVAILLSNNIRDVEDDQTAGVNTIVGIFGVRAARAFYALLIIGAYALIVGMILRHLIVPTAGLVLLTSVMAWRLIQRVWRAKPPLRESMLGVDAATAQLNVAFGIMLIAGIVAWRVTFSFANI